jgi:hypothetical protein
LFETNQKATLTAIGIDGFKAMDLFVVVVYLFIHLFIYYYVIVCYYYCLLYFSGMYGKVGLDQMLIGAL